MRKKLKNILIVFTVGTFSIKIDKKSGGLFQQYSAEQLVNKIPEVKKIANISCYDFGKYPGPHITPEIMIDLSKQIKKRIKEKKYDGIVIRISPSGSILECTYLGGSGSDKLYKVTIDEENDIHIVGSTESNDFPISN